MAETLTPEEFAKRYGAAFETVGVQPTEDPVLGSGLEAPTERGPAKFDPTRVAAGPGAIPQGVDVSEAAPVVLPMALAPFAGAAGGAVGAAARFAMSPAGSGVISAGTALAKGADPLTAVGAGLGAAATDKVLGGSKALRSMLSHTLARGAKVAEKEVAKTVGEQIKKVAAPTVDDVAKRAIELAQAPNAKYSRGQIAEILRSEFATGQEGIGVGYFRKFVDQMLDNAAQAAKGGG